MCKPQGIIVFGANGSGKTTLGRELARILNFKHMDIEAMLAVEARNSTDQRTIGELFYYACDEVEDIKYLTSLMLILELLKKILFENPVISEEIANQIMDTFINALPSIWKKKLKSIFI